MTTKLFLRRFHFWPETHGFSDPDNRIKLSLNFERSKSSFSLFLWSLKKSAGETSDTWKPTLTKKEIISMGRFFETKQKVHGQWVTRWWQSRRFVHLSNITFKVNNILPWPKRNKNHCDDASILGYRRICGLTLLPCIDAWSRGSRKYVSRVRSHSAAESSWIKLPDSSISQDSDFMH